MSRESSSQRPGNRNRQVRRGESARPRPRPPRRAVERTDRRADPARPEDTATGTGTARPAGT
ncbi:hypothetical protein, partial [Corynebacterium bovis]|uniref:hypothetical protein n=1 Tax=Corynebacterium bovis TaxID=36808 RepID=UPI001C8B7A7B